MRGILASRRENSGGPGDIPADFRNRHGNPGHASHKVVLIAPWSLRNLFRITERLLEILSVQRRSRKFGNSYCMRAC